jgi:hypothetical protein
MQMETMVNTMTSHWLQLSASIFLIQKNNTIQYNIYLVKIHQETSLQILQ